MIWLYCYGERFADHTEGRPKGLPRLPKEKAPFIPAEGAIPLAHELLRDIMDYDADKRRLLIGRGYVENVAPQGRLTVASYAINPPLIPALRACIKLLPSLPREGCVT